MKQGEQSGELGKSLARAADLLESEQKLRYQCLSALTYPLVVVGLGGLTGMIAMKLMAPFLIEMLEKEQSLAFSTQLLFAIARLFDSPWLVVFMAAAILAAAVQCRNWLRTPLGRAKRDIVTLRLPLLSPIVRRICLCRILPTLSAMWSSGLPLTVCLESCAEVSGNNQFRADLLRAKSALIRGTPLQVHFAREKALYGSIFVSVITVGLETGDLATVCDSLNRLLNVELQTRLQIAVDLIQPIMLSGLGVFVAFLSLAALDPIYRSVL